MNHSRSSSCPAECDPNFLQIRMSIPRLLSGSSRGRCARLDVENVERVGGCIWLRGRGGEGGEGVESLLMHGITYRSLSLG